MAAGAQENETAPLSPLQPLEGSFKSCLATKDLAQPVVGNELFVGADRVPLIFHEGSFDRRRKGQIFFEEVFPGCQRARPFEPCE
jgi:hypothetical protein